MDKTMDTASDLEPSSRLENQRFVRFGPTFLKTIALSYFFFTIFYGFVKKMVQKNQYTYNVPSGSSATSLTKWPKAKFVKTFYKITIT